MLFQPWGEGLNPEEKERRDVESGRLFYPETILIAAKTSLRGGLSEGLSALKKIIQFQ
jgi:hypothetical protein